MTEAVAKKPTEIPLNPEISEPTQTSVLSPADCTEMADVRAGVDALDQQLVALLAVRQGYMEAAARIKPEEGDVRVPWRIEEVVQNVLAESREKGLSERIAEPVWRLLIEKCIEHELEAWRSFRV